MPTLLLSRGDVAQLLDIGECMSAVESAFRLLAEGKAVAPKVLGIPVEHGGFHIKAGAMKLDRHYFVAKTNANFPGNKKLHNLPLIQGVIIVNDADNGRVLAVMDSIEITIIRTGAATGVATDYLARKDAKTVTICGCGNQGRISLTAIQKVRHLEQVFACDIDPRIARKFSEELSRDLDLNILPVDDFGTAVASSDICVTCTPARAPILFKKDVRPGTFIAAVGTDSEDKNEIDAELIASSTLVADLAEQSASFGDFHHALRTDRVSRHHLHAELGEVIAGKKPGRTSDKEIIVFDSTGTALQDVAAAAIVFEKAVQRGSGVKIHF